MADNTAYPASVERLITEFGRLPGIGRRSAERLAFHVLKSGREEALALAGMKEGRRARSGRGCGREDEVVEVGDVQFAWGRWRDFQVGRVGQPTHDEAGG